MAHRFKEGDDVLFKGLKVKVMEVYEHENNIYYELLAGDEYITFWRIIKEEEVDPV